MALKKKLLIWGSVFNFIVAAFSLYCVIALATNLNGLKDYLQEFIKVYYSPDMIGDILNMVNIYFVIDIVCNVGFGIIYIVYSNYTLEKFNRSKRSLMTITIINVLFGLNIITLVLVLFAMFSGNERDLDAQMAIDNAKAPADSDKFYALAEQITVLKNKLANGEITEEQYKTELNKLISEQAKDN